MAKKKAAQPANVDHQSELFKQLCDFATNEYGDDAVFTGAEAERRAIGLRIPALCLRWAFRSNVFPLGRTTVVDGFSGSGKSALMAEIFGWHIQHKGVCQLVEIENRDAGTMTKMLLGNEAIKYLQEISASNLDAGLDTILRLQTEFCDRTGPHGRPIPLCLGLDSLSAALSNETTEKVAREGVFGRGFAIEAKLITQHIKIANPKLYGYPMSIIYVNHLKEQTGPTGIKSTYIPGGLQQRYSASQIIELRRIKHQKWADAGGMLVRFELEKASIGPSNQAFDVNLYWFDIIDDAGNLISRAEWNWHEASINLLHKFLEGEGEASATQKKRIREILDLTFSHAKRTVWSDTLGISKDSPLSYQDAGAVLESREDILDPLHKALGIHTYHEYVPERPFLEQVKSARQAALGKLTTQVPGEILPDTDSTEEEEPQRGEPAGTDPGE